MPSSRSFFLDSVDLVQRTIPLWGTLSPPGPEDHPPLGEVLTSRSLLRAVGIPSSFAICRAMYLSYAKTI